MTKFAGAFRERYLSRESKLLTRSLQMYTRRLINCRWVSWSDLMLDLTLSVMQVYSILGKCQGGARVERLN